MFEKKMKNVNEIATIVKCRTFLSIISFMIVLSSYFGIQYMFDIQKFDRTNKSIQALDTIFQYEIAITNSLSFLRENFILNQS